MANHSVTDLQSLINQQIDAQEQIQSQLLKANALAAVALSSDFFDFDEEITHAYLWALHEVIAEVKSLNEQSLQMLFQRV